MKLCSWGRLVMFNSLGKDFELLTNEVATLYELYGWL